MLKALNGNTGRFSNMMNTWLSRIRFVVLMMFTGFTLMVASTAYALTPQAITFGAQGGQTFGAAPFALSPLATADSGLPVTYTSTTTSVCLISSTTVTIVTGGTCTIAADQAGDATYSAAPTVTQDIVIAKASQAITFGAQGGQTLGAVPFALSPLATADSGLAVTYTSTTLPVCTISGATVTLVTVGTCTIAADQAGNVNYNAAPQVLQSINVTDNTPPSVPVLTATPVSGTQVNLSWTASTDDVGVTAYKVYRLGILIATLGNVRSYSDTGLTAATLYSYTVEAWDAAGNFSAPSIAAPATTLAMTCTLTAAPASISAGSLLSILTASCNPVAVSYVWTGGTCAGVTVATCTVSPSTTTTYSVTGTDVAAHTASASAQVTVTFSCTLYATPGSIPPGGSSTLTARCTPGTNYSYTWTGGTCAGTTGATCTVTPSATTTYYSVTGSNAAGASVTAYTSVMVAVPSVPVCVLDVLPASILHGRSSILTANCWGATSYVWSGGTCAGITGTTCTVTPAATTTYSVTGSNLGGAGAPASATVTVMPNPATLSVGSSGGWALDQQRSTGFISARGNAKSPPTLPSGTDFPQGLVDFTLTAGVPGGTAAIILTYPDALPQNIVYWKYGPQTAGGAYSWYQFPNFTVSADRKQITLTLTDGALGDDDMLTNGTIADVGGPGVSGAVIEFYNTNLDHYFITADTNEAADIDSGSAGAGWSRTGNTFKSGGSTSVCRFYGSMSPGPNSHFYTADAGECDYLKQLQATTLATEKRWGFESLDFLTTLPANGTCASGTTPVYRAYNNGWARGIDSNHRITTSLSAIQQEVARGWINEGVVMCAPQ